MASTSDIKTEIITQLNFLPKKSLDEVKKFIQLLFVKKQSEHSWSMNKENRTDDSDFFEICGMWQDRDIDSSSFRRKAWREIKW